MTSVHGYEKDKVLTFNSGKVFIVILYLWHHQMHKFILFFINKLLLHISASMCHHQGARMHLLSYVSRQGLVNKILKYKLIKFQSDNIFKIICYLWQTIHFLNVYHIVGKYITPDDVTWWPKHVGVIDRWNINKICAFLVCST
jgi:hypothetical protein